MRAKSSKAIIKTLESVLIFINSGHLLINMWRHLTLLYEW